MRNIISCRWLLNQYIIYTKFLFIVISQLTISWADDILLNCNNFHLLIKKLQAIAFLFPIPIYESSYHSEIQKL